MSIVGTVDGLWRYPVMSMGGEELEESFLGFSGLDRRRYRANIYLDFDEAGASVKMSSSDVRCASEPKRSSPSWSATRAAR
jgi:hypothetical protein